jgi:hypothetical protein
VGVLAAVGCVMGGVSWSRAESSAAVETQAARGVSASAGGYGLVLVAPVQGGLVGWCMAYQTPHRSGGKCPVIPTAERPIVAEAWGAGATSATEVVMLTTSEVATVSVAGGRSPVATRAEAGLPYGLRAAYVEIPGPEAPPARRPRITPLGAGGQAIAQPGPASTPPGYGLPTRSWQRPAHAPRGVCAISATPLSGLSAQSGHVVVALRSFRGIIGRPFLSCVDTEYRLNNALLDAGVVLDAAHPGAVPAALPGMKAVPGHGGVFQAPGWDGRLIGRRTHGAWLLVEGGNGLSQRLTVLEHLRAAVHP